MSEGEHGQEGAEREGSGGRVVDYSLPARRKEWQELWRGCEQPTDPALIAQAMRDEETGADEADGGARPEG